MSTKPADISQDVWTKAEKETAWLRDSEQEFGELDDRTISLIIARAILAERERCGRIADPLPLDGDDSDYEKQSHDIRLNIAHAIRNPVQPADPPRGDNISPSPLGDAGNDDFKRVQVIGSIE
jgi:hypothetical protein